MGKKVEPCYFCERLKECESGCGCSKCIFPEKFNEWGESSPEIREYYRKNELFYKVLFVKAKEFEYRLLMDGIKANLLF